MCVPPKDELKLGYGVNISSVLKAFAVLVGV